MRSLAGLLPPALDLDHGNRLAIQLDRLNPGLQVGYTIITGHVLRCNDQRKPWLLALLDPLNQRLFAQRRLARRFSFSNSEHAAKRKPEAHLRLDSERAPYALAVTLGS